MIVPLALFVGWGVPEQAMSGIPLGFGIVVEDKPSELSCMQVSVQTGEDNEDGEVQTEPIATEEKWVQWPPEDLRGWGKGGAPGDNEGEDEAAVSSGRIGMEGEGALRLIAFLKKASQVSCTIVLTVGIQAWRPQSIPSFVGTLLHCIAPCHSLS